MRTYVEYVADFLLTELGYDVIYGATNPVSRSVSEVFWWH